MLSNNKKIAIYLPESKWLVPETGGTYSLTYSLINEINNSFKLRNQFLLLVDDQSEKELLFNQFSNIESLAINFSNISSKGINKNIFERIKNSIRFRINNFLRLSSVNNTESYVDSDRKKEKYLHKLLTNNQISLIYYPIQHKCLSVNFPFIATNWDVAHKSTFFFPEIAKIFNLREDWYKNVLPKALLVFCESEAGKKELIKYYQINENKIRIQPLIPGGVVDYEVSNERQIYILNEMNVERQMFFFYPAQFWALKNHKILIDSFVLLIQKYKNLKLVLTGSDKGNLDYIKSLCKSNRIINNVIFPGFVEDEQLYVLYKNSIALIMPSLLGPTNMPIIEAIALKCPVVCSDLEGHIEILGSSKQTFSPFDVEDLYKKMEKLVVDNEFRENLIRNQYTHYKTSIFNKNNTKQFLIENIEYAMQLRDLWK